MNDDDSNKLFSAAGVVPGEETLKEGFLSEYWSSKKSLPKLSKVGRIKYYIKSGVSTALSVPASTAITVLTMAVALFLLAGFILIIQNVSGVLETASRSLYASAYINDSASDEQLASLILSLKRNSRVEDVNFITKEKALEQFKIDLGARSGFVEGLESVNPLPRSLDLVFKAEGFSISSDGNEEVQELVRNLRKNELVEEVVFGSQWVDRLQNILGAFRFFGLIGVFLVLGIVIFLISNTIKLVIYSRRDEISIMQLVGASDSFIRIPFVVGGMLQGLIGSIIGVAFLGISFAALNFELRDSEILGIAISGFSFLPIWLILGIILLGVAVGVFGSLMSLGKFLNV